VVGEHRDFQVEPGRKSGVKSAAMDQSLPVAGLIAVPPPRLSTMPGVAAVSWQTVAPDRAARQHAGDAGIA